MLEIEIKLKELEKKKKLLKLDKFTKSEKERLNEEFLIEYTYNSNAIEGNTLTLRETAMVLEGLTIDRKPLKDHLETIGHKDAYNYIMKISNKNKPLSEKLIKDIHSLVLIDRPEDKGIYRSVPVKILGATNIPTEPHLINQRMEELINQYNEKNDKAVIERIAEFHLNFENIHPFIDGNGRTGRLILNLELLKNGYPAIDIKFNDRKKYYDAFEEYSKNNNSIVMIELIIEYLNDRMSGLIKVIGEK